MRQLRAYTILEIYQEFVALRAKPMGSEVLDLLHSAVGASGEAGEYLDSMKKAWVYNKPIDRDNVKEECGDMLFYIQMMCNTLGTDIISLIESNMVKLKVRYPEQYSDHHAQARADKV
jgi:NTP pyrophosphatase (non-canonical NTP hydrolase)